MPATRRAHRFRCHGWPAAAAFRPWSIRPWSRRSWRLRFWPLRLPCLQFRPWPRPRWMSPALPRVAGIALVMGVAGWAEPAEASLTCPALIWTVFTLTGFIGSDEPGIAGDRLGLDHAIGKRCGLGLGFGLDRTWNELGLGTAAVAAEIDRDAGCGRTDRSTARPAQPKRTRPERQPGPEPSARAGLRPRLPRHRYWHRKDCVR